MAGRATLAVLEAMPERLVLVDAEGRIRALNRRARRALALDALEEKPLRLADLVPGSDREALQLALDAMRVRAAGPVEDPEEGADERLEIPLSLRTGDGRVRAFCVRLGRLQEEGQDGSEVLVSLGDRPEEAPDLLADVLHGSPDGIVAFDHDLRYTLWSPAMARMMGVSSEHVLGRPAPEAFPFLDSTRELRHFRAALRGRTVFAAERPYWVHETGRMGWFHAWYGPLRDADGAVQGGMAFVRDVTDQVRRDRQLRLLVHVSLAITKADDFRSALHMVLEEVCRATDWAVGEAWVPTPEGDRVELFEVHHRSPRTARAFEEAGSKRTLLRGEGLTGRTWQDGRAHRLDDVDQDGRFHHSEAARLAGLKAAAAIPVLADREVVAVLTFLAAEAWGEDADRVVALVSGVGAQVGEAVLRRRAGDALRSSESRLRSVLDSAREAIVTADEEGRITGWNEGARIMFGWTAAEVVGKPLAVLMPDEYRGPHAAALERAQRTGVHRLLGRTIELKGLRKDGMVFPLELSLGSWQQGDRPHYTGVLRDMTQRRRTERLARHTAELKRRNAELQEFAYAASHDLQEPLRMVAAYTELLARRYKGRLDADADDFIAYAVDGARRMQGLIRALLDYARVETRGAEPRGIDLGAVLEDALANLKAAVQESGAVVTHDPLPVAVGDRVQLVQVFQNLLSNAIKFRRVQPPHIHVGARRDGEDWVLSVTDDGLGIEPSQTERAFAIFQRLHARDRYPGTGIGLALCKRILERHGGEIWVESEPGRGSTFSFRLPAPAEDDLDAESASEPPGVGEEWEEEGAPDTPPRASPSASPSASASATPSAVPASDPMAGREAPRPDRTPAP